MMLLKRAKVQVNAIISVCIQFVPGRLRRAWERARNARSVHKISRPPAPLQHGSVGVGISCRSERNSA
jgi:hypothetical protein